MSSLRFTAMQLIQLERDDWNFFCPATGQPVFKDTGEPNASTVRAFWCHEVPGEPELLCDELQPQWAAHVAIQDALEDGVDVVVSRVKPLGRFATTKLAGG